MAVPMLLDPIEDGRCPIVDGHAVAIVHKCPSSVAETFALWLSACMAADKGIPNKVVPCITGDYLVVADDRRAIWVQQTRERCDG